MPIQIPSTSTGSGTSFPHGEHIIVRSTITERNDYGDTVTDVVEEDWGPCAIAPRTSTERADSRSPAVIEGLTVYGPNRDLDADDELIIYGEVYQIEGRPGVWRNPFTGWAPGIEVAVTRASGV